MKGKFKFIMCFLIGALIFSMSAVLAYSYVASNVGFTPKDNNWDVDNVKDAVDSLHYDVSDYKDFDIKITEINGTYIKVEVPSEYINNSYTYKWYLNKIPVYTGSNSSYVFDDLNADTGYRLRVVIDTGASKYYSYDYVRTLDRQILYKEGSEYNYLTGGWKGEIVDEGCTPKRGLFQKTSKYMLLYYSTNGCSMSRFSTTNTIKSNGFNYLNVKYYKSSNLGSMKYIVINGTESTYTTSDWIIDKVSYSGKNQIVKIHNWDSYDYIFEVFLSN